MSTSPTICPLTQKHLDDMGVDSLGLTIRGIAAELDGDTLGVAGVIHSSPTQAFSQMDDRLRRYPKTIMLAARKFREILEAYPVAYAVASKGERNSDKFIQRVGFAYLQTTTLGRTYKWQPQSR